MEVIDRLALLQALEIVKPGLSSKDVIEQSTSFAFIDGRVVTYNDEISISHPVSAAGITGAVKADELYQILGKIKKPEIHVECTDTELIFKAGKATVRLTRAERITLPIDEIGETGEWSKLPKSFCKHLRFALRGVSSDMSRPILTCAHIKQNGVIESTDSYRIVQCKGKKMPVENFLLSGGVIPDVIKAAPTHISMGAGWVHFKTEEGTVISCRVFNDKFVAVDAFLEFEGVEVTFPSIIKDVIDRASVFAKQDKATDESITIELKKGSCKVSAQSVSGSFEEVIKMDYNEDTLSFVIVPQLFKDILTETSSCKIGDGRVTFEGDDWKYLSILKSTSKKN